ncbi:malonate--CoA ligase isoform X2 [Coffea eugenioides]|uniref:Probable CoA ligase CCL8 isoform X2 n=1 Tax=Coffea arabica TaxID=13443 RepID=A0ABM4U7E6_COFAR|nr:malonate--CoA ligase isoform X1 [Coffea arabica]XP_027168056.1 malonate--CoA ligase isoform X2 [Coffea eugenioides]
MVRVAINKLSGNCRNYCSHLSMTSFNPKPAFNCQLQLLISLRRLPKNSSSSFVKTRILCPLPLLQVFRENPTNPTSQVRFLSSASRSNLLMELVKAVASKGSQTGQSIAVRSEQKSYSYHQLISSAWRISTLLCNGGLKTAVDLKGNKHLGGIRIGIVAKPCAEFVAGILGTWLSGGVAVPLALSYPEAELLHVMNDSDVSMILSTEDHQEILKDVAAKTAAHFSLLPPVVSTSTELDQSHNGELNVIERVQGIENFSEIEDEKPALILYTSGTTGKPKGVVHTHGSILAQVQMLANAWEYSPSDQFLHCLPLHHVHGLFNALLAPLYAGSVVEFMPKFSVRGIWQRWRESYPRKETKVDDAITVFTGVPTMYTRLIQGYEAMDPELQAISALAAGQLRLMMCGSSALPLPIMQQWEAITGHRLLERYGMTEFVMAISNPLRGVRKGGTVGKPLPGVQVKILAEDGSDDDKSGVGELCVKSPSLFKGYWKLPKVTEESFIDGGFFKTGDAVRVDEDGYYIILGRTNADIMKAGGYKLSALEIEAVLLEHPVISECCVLGLPDRDYGEAVCAIVVPDAEVKRKREEELKPALSLEELSTWAKEKLAPYKLPTRLLLWESLPRNAMGKVNKKDLKRKLAADVQ